MTTVCQSNFTFPVLGIMRLLLQYSPMCLSVLRWPMSNNKPLLLVIGATGFVGAWAARLGHASFQVVEGARRTGGSPNSLPIDISRVESIQTAFRQATPDVVLLTAAMTDIDLCEREPQLADLVNYHGVVHVANECLRNSIRLIFTSSDAVFDGTRNAYSEDDAPSPVNHYGRTKARAEAAIREILPSAAIVRSSLVLGPALAPDTNSYLDKLDAMWKAGRSVPTPAFEFRNPIDVVTLAKVLLNLAARDAAGVFHVGSSDKLSRYELARRLAVEMGYSPQRVVPQNEPTPGRAPRGIDDFLVCRRLPRITGFVPPSCEEVVRNAVHATT